MSELSPDATHRPCKACGKKLIFAVNPKSGKSIPLDVASRAHIYELLDAAEGGDVAEPVSQQEVYVSHFLTCPAASSFSRKASAK